jgi:hypothetical protein
MKWVKVPPTHRYTDPTVLRVVRELVASGGLERQSDGVMCCKSSRLIHSIYFAATHPPHNVGGQA